MFRRSAPSRPVLRDRWCPPDQVFNRPDALADLTPVSQAPAEAVRGAWAPTLHGQAVPTLGERVCADAEPCNDV